jgi:hypothetical protein
MEEDHWRLVTDVQHCRLMLPLTAVKMTLVPALDLLFVYLELRLPLHKDK